MAIAQQNRFETAPGGLAKSLANRDVAILIGYAAFAMVMMLAAIYFASTSPGTAPADFAVMTVFP
jgi:hypothetical protein